MSYSLSISESVAKYLAWEPLVSERVWNTSGILAAS